MARIFTDSVFYHLERKAPGFSHGEHQQYPYTLEKCLSAKQHYTNALRLALFARPAGRLTRALLHPIHIKNPLSAKNVKKGISNECMKHITRQPTFGARETII